MVDLQQPWLSHLRFFTNYESANRLIRKLNDEKYEFAQNSRSFFIRGYNSSIVYVNGIYGG